MSVDPLGEEGPDKGLSNFGEQDDNCEIDYETRDIMMAEDPGLRVNFEEPFDQGMDPELMYLEAERCREHKVRKYHRSILGPRKDPFHIKKRGFSS